jgi:hypothetical protein
MATATTYIDPTGKRNTGYIIDGLTYTDEMGTSRVPVGSMVQTNDGVYQLHNSGSTLVGKTLPATSMQTSSNALPAAQTAEKYINDLYARQMEAQKAALRSAYEQSVNTLNQAAQKIPQQYQNARNETAGQGEVQRAAFNEYASASGLGSGAQAQAQLAIGSQTQRGLADISRAETNALQEIENQRVQLETQYRNAVQQALAEGDMAKAQALYQEFVRVDEANRETARYQAQLDMSRQQAQQEQQNLEQQRQLQLAQMLGQYGNFSGFNSFYTPEQIASMEQAYQQQMAQQQAQQELERRLTEAQIANIYSGIDNKKKNEDDEPAPSPFYEATGNYRFADPGALFTQEEYNRFAYELMGYRSKNGQATAIEDAVKEGKITESQAYALLSRFGIA